MLSGSSSNNDISFVQLSTFMYLLMFNLSFWHESVVPTNKNSIREMITIRFEQRTLAYVIIVNMNETKPFISAYLQNYVLWRISYTST